VTSALARFLRARLTLVSTQGLLRELGEALAAALRRAAPAAPESWSPEVLEERWQEQARAPLSRC
jgi:hypothetical protein